MTEQHGGDEAAPLVYCVILNLNGRELLLETLASVSQMDYANFRMLVVDNGSNDDSVEAVRRDYPQVELIETGENLGFGGGNNVGIEHALAAGADWVFLLNNDITVDPALLTELLHVAATDWRIGVLGAKIYYHHSPDRIWYAGGRVNFVTGIISHRGIRKADRGQFDEVEDTGYVTGCAFLIRRAALEVTGGFDPLFHPSYTEDADLSLRVQRAGFRTVYVPAGKVWHKVSSFSGGELTPFKTRLKVTHNLLFFRRYARWYHWLTIPLFFFGAALVFSVRELLRGRVAVVAALLRGMAGGLRRPLR